MNYKQIALVALILMLAMLSGPVMAATYDTSNIPRNQFDWVPDPRIFYVTIHNVQNSGGWTGLHVEHTLIRTTLGRNTSHSDVPIVIRDDTDTVTLGTGTMSVVGKEYALTYSNRRYYYYDIDISVDDWTPPAGKTGTYRIGIRNQSSLGGWWGPAGRGSQTYLSVNHPVWSNYTSSAQLVVWKSGYDYKGFPSDNTVEYSEISDPAPPVADFACNFDEPLKQSPFDLICYDNSTSYPAVSSVNWSLTQPDASVYSTGNDTLTKTLIQTGLYGLEYEACNSYGCGYANTTQLVNITSGLIPATGISFWVHTYDPITGAKIGPSDIGIGNVTSGGWRNSSTNLGTAKFDSTDYARLEKLTVGQNVNLCGEAPGYQETCTNVSIAYDGWEYILNLVRTDLVPAGNQSTMIVNVINSNTAQTIPGVSLTISNSSVPYSSSKLSDSNGIATFSNIPAAGSYQIAASKTGYVSATKFWPVYPGQVSNAYIGMLPVGVTPVTTGPGGDPIYITPTTTTTYAPGETPDTRTDEEKDEDMMGILRDNGEMLIQFFILCFVVYMIMGMAGRGGR